MENAELMEELLALASEAGLEVRLVGSAESGESDGLPSSALCRVRGAVWVVLSRADPTDVQIRVLAQALKSHASDLIESRYLPPAVRNRLGVE